MERKYHALSWNIWVGVFAIIYRFDITMLRIFGFFIVLYLTTNIMLLRSEYSLRRGAS